MLAVDWMEELWAAEDDDTGDLAGSQAPGASLVRHDNAAAEAAGPQPPAPSHNLDRWALARKFLDYLEANAEQYWEVPRCELAVPAASGDAADAAESAADEAGQDTSADEPGDLFSAAYEGMSYRDSTDDGFEGEMLEGGQTGQDATDFELVLEAERIVSRLSFLATLAQLWKLAAVASFHPSATGPRPAAGTTRIEGRAGRRRAAADRAARPGPAGVAGPGRREPPGPREPPGRHPPLFHPAPARHPGIADRIRPPPRRQGNVAGADHRRLGRDGRCRPAAARGDGRAACGFAKQRGRSFRRRAASMGGAGRADAAGSAPRRRGRGPQGLAEFLAALAQQTILYVALARGGHPQRLVASRGLQAVLRRLLAYLPRLGLLRETAQLLAAIQEMEVQHPVGPAQ